MTIVVTDAQVAMLRAVLTGDAAQYRRLTAEQDPDGFRTGFATLIAAAFCQGARRRFAGGGAARVIEYVGEVRSRSDEAADTIDPRIAERLIFAAHTGEDIRDLKGLASFTTQIRLLRTFIDEEARGSSALDLLLARARTLADRLLA